LIGKSGKYSKDLFVQAVSSNVLGEVSNDVNTLRNALETEPSLRLALKVQKPDENLLDGIVQEGKFNKVTQEFLYYLREDKQFKSFGSILDGFVSLYNDYNHITSAEVTVSSGASKEEIAYILGDIKAAFPQYKNIQFNIKKSDEITLGYKLTLGQYEFDESREGEIEDRNAELTTRLEGAEAAPETWAPPVTKENQQAMETAYLVAGQEPANADEANQFWEYYQKDEAALKTAVDQNTIPNFERPVTKETTQLKPVATVDRNAGKIPAGLKSGDKLNFTAKDTVALATKGVDTLVALNVFENVEPVPKIMERYKEYLAGAKPTPSIKLMEVGNDGKVKETELVKNQSDVDGFYRSLPTYIGRRVFFNPESDQYLFDAKIAAWKLQVSEMVPDDPARTPIQKAIAAFEETIYKVNYTPPPLEQNPTAFANLVKKTPEELAEVPIEVLKRLPPSQLAKLDLKSVLAVVNKQIDYEPVDVPAVQKLDLTNLKPVDLDVISMDINDDLRLNLRAKQLAIEYAAKSKNIQVDPLTVYTLSAEQLKSQYKLEISNSFDQRIKELADLKKATDSKIQAQGLTPLPDRLEWFKF
jgi:F0F1-type ATP synthase delta subunit